MRLLNSYKCFLDLSRPLYLIRIKEENLDKNKKLNHQKQSCEHFNRTAFNPKEIIYVDNKNVLCIKYAYNGFINNLEIIFRQIL